MARGPLSERYQLPVRLAAHVRAVCDPTSPLHAGDQDLHEDLSPVQGGPRFARIERRLRSSDGIHRRELVTGHSGCGKSTELLRLVAQLRTPKDGRYFHVVYVDADEYLSPWELRLPQVLVAVLAALQKEPRLDLKETKAARPLLDGLRRIAAPLGEVSEKLASVAGLPLLATALKVSSDLAGKFSKDALRQRQELLDLTRNLILEVRAQLPAEVPDIVFVIDNLEKVPEQTLDGGHSLHEILFTRDLPALDLPAHLVLTYPISLNYSTHELDRAHSGAIRTTLPMVSVRQPPQDPTRGDDRDGLAAMMRLLARRVDLTLFASAEVVEHVARLSGGCVRDLLRIVGELPIAGDGRAPFTMAMVDTVASEFRNDYARLLQGKPYVARLPSIARTGEIPDDLELAWRREILLGLVVLEYDTDTWFDVHPLVTRTRSYVRAEQADARANQADGRTAGPV
jgi:hypothetical protein